MESAFTNPISIPKLSNSNSWWMVICGAVALLLIPLLIYLQLASGYSGKFLGLWIPPNSVEFRMGVGIAMLVTINVSVLLNGLVFLWGGGLARRAATVLIWPGVLILAWAVAKAVFNF
jgi:hypothetical protein